MTEGPNLSRVASHACSLRVLGRSSGASREPWSELDGPEVRKVIGVSIGRQATRRTKQAQGLEVRMNYMADGNRRMRNRTYGGVGGGRSIPAPYPILIAPVPACCWGFLRTPADFASRPNWPFRATFHSLLAIPRSDLAPWNWPEVRKGRNAGPYRSMGYARTNQAVGLQHRVAEETLWLRFVGSCRALPTHCNTDDAAWMMANDKKLPCQDNVRTTTIEGIQDQSGGAP